MKKGQEDRFWQALAAGDVTTLQTLVNRGLVIHRLRDIHQNTPLHRVLTLPGANHTALNWLLNQRADLAAQNQFGYTPLHLAFRRPLDADQAVSLQYLWAAYLADEPLLKRVAALVDQSGRLPLHYAVRQGELSWVQRLVAAGSPLAVADREGLTSLHEAVKRAHLAIAEWLLTHGAPATAQDLSGRTPLHYALAKEDGLQAAALALLLLKHGALWEQRDREHRLAGDYIKQPAALLNAVQRTYSAAEAQPLLAHLQPLVLYQARTAVSPAMQLPPAPPPSPPHAVADFYDAISQGRVDLLATLPQPPALNTIRNAQGATLLQVAIQAQQDQLVSGLLSAGCLATLPDTFGYTALHWATKLGRADYVAACIQQQPAVINMVDNQRRSALHYACRDQAVTLADFLLQHGADPNLPDKEGVTPLHWAASRGEEAIVRLLLQHDAKVYRQDHLGWQPLHCALHKRHSAIARLLVKHGADPQRVNQAGQTPLQLLQLAADPQRELKQLPEELLHLARVYRQQLTFHQLLRENKSQSFKASNYLIEQQQLRQQLEDLSEPDVVGDAVAEVWERLKQLPLPTLAPYLAELKTLLEASRLAPLLVAAKEPRFKTLQAHIHALEKCHHQLASEPGWAAVAQGLERLADHYRHYLKQCQEAQGEALERLLQPPILLRVVGRRPRCLQPAFADILQAEASTTQSAHGTHVVKSLAGIHFKRSPHAPGVEFMVDRLNKLLTGQGSAPTELLKIIAPNGASQVYLASKTVVGAELQYLLENEPELIEKITPAHYSAMMVLSLLTSPEDGKPDNYMVKPTVDDQATVQAVEIIGIDNDIAFAPAIAKEARSNVHFIRVKNVLYFFPQMQAQVDESFRAAFLALCPALLLIQWLRALWEQNQAYEALQQEGILSADELTALHLPIRFKTGTVTALYHKLLRLQAFMRAHPTATHWELVAELEPLLKAYYHKLYQEKQGDILACIHALYYGAPTVETYLETDQAPELQAAVAAYQETAYAFEDRQQTVSAAAEAWLAEVDPAYLREEEVREFYTTLPQLHFIQQLTLRNSQHLTPERLMTLLNGFPNLTHLTLSEKTVAATTLCATLMARRYPPPIVRLEPTCSLGPKDWMVLTEALGEHWLLRLQTHWVALGQAPEQVFAEVLSQGGCSPPLLDFLIGQRGLDVQARWEGIPLVHLAIQHQAWETLTALVQAGADLTVQDEAGITVYERLQQLGQNTLLETLALATAQRFASGRTTLFASHRQPPAIDLAPQQRTLSVQALQQSPLTNSQGPDSPPPAPANSSSSRSTWRFSRVRSFFTPSALHQTDLSPPREQKQPQQTTPQHAQKPSSS